MKTLKQEAAHAAQAATEAQEKKPDAEVIDMPRPVPATIQLTKAEILEFENLSLKETLVQSQARESLSAIQAQRAALVKSASDRTGTDITKYKITKEGTGILSEKGEAQNA